MLQGPQSNPFISLKRKEAPVTKALLRKNRLVQHKTATADQFIRTQSAIKFSGKEPGSKSIQDDQAEQAQLRASCQFIYDEISEKEEQLNPYLEEAEKKKKKINTTAGWSGAFATVAASTAGHAKLGMAADGATGLSTLGAGTATMAAVGFINGIMVAAWPAMVSNKIAEVVTKGTDTAKLVPEVAPLLKELKALEGRNAPIVEQLAIINRALEEASKTVKGLEETETIAKTAIDEKAFKPEHFHHVKNGLESVYQEVFTQGKRVAKLCVVIPGFAKTYGDITKGKLWRTDMHQGNQTILDNGTDIERAAALRRLRILDSNRTIKYIDYTNDPEHFPELAMAALQILTQNPNLRPGNPKAFHRAIERVLASNNERLIDAGLDVLAAVDVSSGTVNYYLDSLADDQLAARKLKRHNSQIKSKAKKIIEARSKTGTYHSQVYFDPAVAVDNLMQTLVGNEGVSGILEGAVLNYKAASCDPKNQMPALKFYLYGAPGIGKTTLVHNIHQEFQGDSGEGIVKIHFGRPHDNQDDLDGPVDSAARLVERLRQAAPLQGKTIFFDEFSDLTQLSAEQQQGIAITLRQLFDRNRIAPGQQHPFKAVTGIDPRHAILTVATNTDIDAVRIDEEGNEFPVFQHLDGAVKRRIKGGAVKVELASDLEEHIPEFVRNFVPTSYFRKTAADAQWASDLQITPAAQGRLIGILSDDGEYSGSALTDTVVEQVNTAILRYNNSHKSNPLATNADNKVSQPLTLDLAQNNLFIVNPQSRT